MLHRPRKLDASFPGYGNRPTPRILQFGGGNFMRGFFDFKVDVMNEACGGDWGIVIIRAVADSAAGALRAQDGLYTVVERGLDEAGRPASKARIVRSVLAELFAREHWWTILSLARRPEVGVVTSNATDAGLALDDWDLYDDVPPRSFPAKLTRLLHERWKYLRGRPGSGWQVIPCELVEDNGDTLADLVRRQARIWSLEPEFLSWLASANTFYNTLVDRIVPGYPHGEAEEIQSWLGYEDQAIVVAERFHFFAIERKPWQPDLLVPLAAHDPGTTVTESVAAYRSRKVSILNGAHTALCPLALMAGFETVRETMDFDPARRFLSALLADEIMPQLGGPRAELDEYAESVFRRLANPYIAHRWHDIALNGLAKLRVRLLPHLAARISLPGAVFPLLSLSLAAWLAFYNGRFASAKAIPPRDGADILARMTAIASLDDGSDEGRMAMIEAFLDEKAFWQRSLASGPLRLQVAGHYRFLTEVDFDSSRFRSLMAACCQATEPDQDRPRHLLEVPPG